MLELRKDYILDRWVIIAGRRSKRPKEFKEEKKKKELKKCFFCPGNENLTPPEIWRIEKNGKWQIRLFPNKFPFVEEKGSPILKESRFFLHSAAYGKHEILVETPEHNKQLWDLGKERIKLVFKAINRRINELMDMDNIKYVLVFKNHGDKAGTSLVHSHMQIVAISVIPPAIREEIEATRKYKECPYCSIIKLESKTKRKAFENRRFLAFTPYASRFNYEVWVFPKRHIRNLSEFDDEDYSGLADILRKILLKLKKLNLSYNFYLHYSPEKSDLHFHIEITPRIAIWAGFEFSSGVTINSVSPEDAARFYRG